MSNLTSAWLLRPSDNLMFTIGQHEAAEYIESLTLHHVPLTVEHCKGAIFWRNTIVPVIDMGVLCDDECSEIKQNFIVVKYQTEDNTPIKYIAFTLQSSPEAITISDEDMINEWPEDYFESLSPFVLSLFNRNEEIVSVFDISRLAENFPRIH